MASQHNTIELPPITGNHHSTSNCRMANKRRQEAHKKALQEANETKKRRKAAPQQSKPRATRSARPSLQGQEGFNKDWGPEYYEKNKTAKSKQGKNKENEQGDSNDDDSFAQKEKGDEMPALTGGRGTEQEREGGVFGSSFADHQFISPRPPVANVMAQQLSPCFLGMGDSQGSSSSLSGGTNQRIRMGGDGRAQALGAGGGGGNFGSSSAASGQQARLESSMNNQLIRDEGRLTDANIMEACETQVRDHYFNHTKYPIFKPGGRQERKMLDWFHSRRTSIPGLSEEGKLQQLWNGSDLQGRLHKVFRNKRTTVTKNVLKTFIGEVTSVCSW